MTPTLPSGVPSKAKACSNEAPAGFHNSAFSFDGSAAMAGTCRVRINRRRKAAQIRTRLSLMRVAAMHYHVDPVESAFEEMPIGLELERVRDHARGVREHAILGDNGIPFDATRMGNGNLFPTG